MRRMWKEIWNTGLSRQTIMEFQAASDYPTSHVMTPGQRQRMIDILQPVRWAGAMDGDTEAVVTQRNLLAAQISMRR